MAAAGDEQVRKDIPGIYGFRESNELTLSGLRRAGRWLKVYGYIKQVGHTFEWLMPT